MGVQRTSILFLSADPTDESRLRLGQELRDIQTRLSLANMSSKFELHHRASVRPSDVTQAIFDTKPAIIHFSGHGSAIGELFLENDAGARHPVEPEALESLFALFKDSVQCVILNACYSSKQARAISRHINNVIGMSNAIGDPAAIAFSIGFYKALGAGRSIKDCFEFGRTELRLHNIPEHRTPILLQHSSIHHVYLDEADYVIKTSKYQEYRFPSRYASFARLFLERGARRGCILINPQAYDNVGAMLDDVYVNYLKDEVPILSYGTFWLIFVPDIFMSRLVVPWEWAFCQDTAAQWRAFRELPLSDVRIATDTTAQVLLADNGFQSRDCTVLAVNHPISQKIIERGGKPLMLLISMLRQVPSTHLDQAVYRDKIVISNARQSWKDRTATARVDDYLSESELIEIQKIFNI